MPLHCSSSFGRKVLNTKELNRKLLFGARRVCSPWPFRTYDDSGPPFAKKCHGIGPGPFPAPGLKEVSPGRGATRLPPTGVVSFRPGGGGRQDGGMSEGKGA